MRTCLKYISAGCLDVQNRISQGKLLTNYKTYCIITILLIGLLIGLVDKSNFSGWFLLSLSYITLLLVPSFSRSKALFLTLLLTLSLHHIVSIVVLHFHIKIFYQNDSDIFNKLATIYLNNGFHFKNSLTVGTQFYAALLSMFYHIQKSVFFGQEMSIFVFLLSNIIIINLLDILETSQFAVPVLLLYGILPNQLVSSSLILRESWQAIFLIAFFYYSLKWHLTSSVCSFAGIISLAFAFCFSLLHKGFAIYIAFFACLFLVLDVVYKCRWKIILARIGILSMFIIILHLFFHQYLTGFQMVTRVSHHGFVGDANIYRTKLLRKHANSGYPSTNILFAIYYYLSGPSLFSIIKGQYIVYKKIIVCYFYYLLKNIITLFALINAFLVKAPKKNVYIMLLIFYFSINILWSAYTTNYGTAMRHLMISDWAIIVAGVPLICRFLNLFRTTHAADVLKL